MGRGWKVKGARVSGAPVLRPSPFSRMAFPFRETQASPSSSLPYPQPHDWPTLQTRGPIHGSLPMPCHPWCPKRPSSFQIASQSTAPEERREGLTRRNPVPKICGFKAFQKISQGFGLPNPSQPPP